MTEYLSCAETAKLIRAALKKAFPGIKFSVRSSVYAGGASIDVGWTDGPCRTAVERVAKVYAGGGFDGMIDMAYSTSAWLMPDGSAADASSPGTSGSKGVYQPYSYPAPKPEAKKVHFGSDFVFCNKKWSLETYTAAVNKVCATYGIEAPEIVDGPYAKGSGSVYVKAADLYLDIIIHRELESENLEYRWKHEEEAA